MADNELDPDSIASQWGAELSDDDLPGLDGSVPSEKSDATSDIPDDLPDDLPGDWAAMLDGGGDDEDDDDGVDRVLNQDEIDNLLGFDSSAIEDENLSGVRALINSALVSYERLPMLEIVF